MIVRLTFAAAAVACFAAAVLLARSGRSNGNAVWLGTVAALVALIGPPIGGAS